MFKQLKSLIFMEKNVAADRPFSVGEKIEVIEGAFTGFEGVVETIDAGERTLYVQLNVAGKRLSAQLKYAHVHRIMDAG